MADEKSMSAEEAAEDESEQALIPRSFFAGKDIEVGSTCKVKVEGIFDDEIAVSYVPHKKKDGKDKDSDDDDDDDDKDSKPKRRRDRHRHWREGEMMDHAMTQMDGMGAPPAPGGY